MDTTKLIQTFRVWFEQEGRFMIPSTSDEEEIKKVLLIAWLNGAYIMEESLKKLF